MTELRSWATTWARRLVADGGPHGPGSRRTIALDNDTWHYLHDVAAITRRLHELQQSAPRPSGRYAVTYDQPLHGTEGLFIYAVEYRDDAPPQRVHLAQPFRKLPMGGAQATGDVIEISDDPARTTKTIIHAQSRKVRWLDQPPALTNTPPIRAPERQQIMRDNNVTACMNATPRPPLPPPTDAHQARPAAGALGSTRRYLDGVLMAVFGVFCLVISGAQTTNQPATAIVVGVIALAYSAYIAFSWGSYVMLYIIYVVAIAGIASFYLRIGPAYTTAKR